MMSHAVRKIIHCDCDCFYAAVEMRDNPALIGVPLAVGGSAAHRGVIATCNYEARAFGVRSAMPTAQALQRCPHLIVLPPTMEKYREASRQIMGIYAHYTDQIEPLSLDEAYLDVSASTHLQGSATRIAQEIRARIKQDVGITASAGVAPNKFLAKIASDWQKPDGLFVIRPQDIASFVPALAIDKLFGVGKVTAAKLHAMQVHTCADLQTIDRAILEQQFGKFGQRLYELCRGIDQREVQTHRVRKSISVEETYTQDLPDLSACMAQLPTLQNNLEERIRRANTTDSIYKVFVKIRFSNFKHTSAECLANCMDHSALHTLLQVAYQRGNLPVRLIGIGVRLRATNPSVQASLFH
jgi:DNA polymerase-4